MKIGINGRFLAKPHTGIGQYTKHLFLTLAQQNPDVRFILVTPENVSIETPQNMEICTVRENFPGIAGMRKTYWEQHQVPRFLAHKKVDLFHFPYPANPWRKLDKPVTVTIHDVIPWSLPAYRSSLPAKIYHDQCRKALKYADHIFAVSKATKTDFMDLCAFFPEKKITVAYNAPNPIFFVRLEENQKRAVLNKYGIEPSRPYIFYIGGFDERKNVELLAHTFFNDIAPHYEIDLVLAGGKTMPSSLYGSFDRLTTLKHEGRVKMLKGKLVLAGAVLEEDLPALYQSSLVFANLSYNEGCNLPLLEAAVSQIPLIASDIPVHREMVGDVSLFCPPDNGKILASLITQLVSDKAFYQRQKQKLITYRCPFSWSATANEVMNIYRQFI